MTSDELTPSQEQFEALRAAALERTLWMVTRSP